MPFWGTATLKRKIQELDIVYPFKAERIKQAAYEMALGGEAFLTSSETKKKIILSPGEELSIPPGQLALLMTEELVMIPDNVIGFISIRAGIKFRGLVNVSGFHVDPGYNGKLLFTVYNAGSRDITISRGQAIFLLWLSTLDQTVADGYTKEKKGHTFITSEDMMRLSGDIASPAALKKEIEQIKTDFDKRIHTLQTSFAVVISLLLGILLMQLKERRSTGDESMSVSKKTTNPSPPASTSSTFNVPASPSNAHIPNGPIDGGTL
jgi:dCTP deaminase